MAKLAANQCFQVIKTVDLTPVLAVFDQLTFVHVNNGGNQGTCHVVLDSKFPPALKEFVANLGLGGTCARAMLRRLEPRQGIAPHTDTWMPAEADWRRFQVPIISHPDILMRWPDDSQETHLAPGFIYEVRFDRTHEVVNPTDIQRTHLQIDQIDAEV